MVVKSFSFKVSIASSILLVPVRANASSRLPKTKSISYESIFSNFSRKPPTMPSFDRDNAFLVSKPTRESRDFVTELKLESLVTI